MNNTVSLKEIIREAKRAAKELYYEWIMPDVMEMLDGCASENEVERIMMKCRRAM